MSSSTEILQLLEEKLENLQRDTFFCIHNYDYHHRNNEQEIIQHMQDTLKDSLQDGLQFVQYMKNMRSSINKAHKKCLEVDELLVNLGVKTEIPENEETQPVGSRSFHEEQEAAKYCVDTLEENKKTPVK